MNSFEYSQPEAYHFCQDSVIAPRLIAADLPRSNVGLKALDLCAGCGVMGFELLHALKEEPLISQFDFLDVQSEFEDHFRKNLVVTGFAANWIHANYETLANENHANTYDLIIANPPYFLQSEGSLSDSSLNNRARFFLDADFRQLLKSVRNALKPQGRAYILMKSGKEHGRDAFTSARIELFDCDVQRLEDVRGTDLVRIIKARI